MTKQKLNPQVRHTSEYWETEKSQPVKILSKDELGFWMGGMRNMVSSQLKISSTLMESFGFTIRPYRVQKGKKIVIRVMILDASGVLQTVTEFHDGRMDKQDNKIYSFLNEEDSELDDESRPFSSKSSKSNELLPTRSFIRLAMKLTNQAIYSRKYPLESKAILGALRLAFNDEECYKLYEQKINPWSAYQLKELGVSVDNMAEYAGMPTDWVKKLL